MKTLHRTLCIALSLSWIACGGKPAAPTQVIAVAGDGQATVSWSPPPGSDKIQSYVVTTLYYSSTQHADRSTVPAGTSAVISHLTNGQKYTFVLQAVDSAGAGATSAPSNEVTPMATPGKPTAVAAVAGNGLAVVTFSAPPGAAEVDSYLVMNSSGTGTVTLTDPTLRSAVVGGLTNGVSYTFTVVARNSAVQSAPSDPSAPVTPSAANNAPMIVLPSTLSASSIPHGFNGQLSVTNQLVVQGDLPPITPPNDRIDEFYFLDCSNCADGTHHYNFEFPVRGTTVPTNLCPAYSAWPAQPALYQQPFCYYSYHQGFLPPEVISTLPPGTYTLQMGFAQIQTNPAGPGPNDFPGPRIPLIVGPGVTGSNNAYLVGSFTITP